MQIKTKYNIGDQAFTIDKMTIYRVSIDDIDIKVTKSFKKEHIEIRYKITAHTGGYLNFIPSNSPISENELYDSPENIINNIKIEN